MASPRCTAADCWHAVFWFCLNARLAARWQCQPRLSIGIGTVSTKTTWVSCYSSSGHGFKDSGEMGWHYPWGLASGHTLVLHGFVVHESYVLCVLTNSVALLTANHSSPLHSLSNPEERCWRTTAFFFIPKVLLLFLFHVQFTDTLSLFFLFCFFLAIVHSTDVPKNFTVKWATKTTVVLAWKFSESRSPYKCTVSSLKGKKKFQLSVQLLCFN